PICAQVEAARRKAPHVELTDGGSSEHRDPSRKAHAARVEGFDGQSEWGTSADPGAFGEGEIDTRRDGPVPDDDRTARADVAVLGRTRNVAVEHVSGVTS